MAIVMGCTTMPIYAAIKVQSIKVISDTGKTAILAKGKQIKLKVTVKVDSNASKNRQVTYKSKNTKIATVNKKGVIKGKKEGITSIIVTSKENKKKSVKVKVKITKPIKSVKLNKTSLSLKKEKRINSPYHINQKDF